MQKCHNFSEMCFRPRVRRWLPQARREFIFPATRWTLNARTDKRWPAPLVWFVWPTSPGKVSLPPAKTLVSTRTDTNRCILSMGLLPGIPFIFLQVRIRLPSERLIVWRQTLRYQIHSAFCVMDWSYHSGVARIFSIGWGGGCQISWGSGPPHGPIPKLPGSHHIVLYVIFFSVVKLSCSRQSCSGTILANIWNWENWTHIG